MSAKPNQLIADAMLAIEAELETELGWDKGATLWVVVPDRKDPFGIRLTPVVVPVAVGSLVRDPRPYLGLYAVAQSGMPWPPDVRAVVFACEGWMVTGKGAEEIEKVLAAAEERTIKHRPDRQEVRFVQGLDRDGRVYAVNRVRGDAPVVWSGLDDDPAMSLDGYVLDAIKALAKVVMG